MAMQIKRTTGGSETWNKWGRCTAAEIKYLVLFPTSKRNAILGVINVAPTAYGEDNELPLKEFRFDGYVGEGDIEITAVYASEDSSGGDDSGDEEVATMSFDCGSGTKHVVTAIKQTKVQFDRRRGRPHRRERQARLRCRVCRRGRADGRHARGLYKVHPNLPPDDRL